MYLELPSIAASAYQDMHVWSALLTCMRPLVKLRLTLTALTPWFREGGA